MPVRPQQRIRLGRHGRRVVDFVFYVAIAVAIVIAVLLWASHTRGELNLKWVGLVVITPITFGYAIRDTKEFWKKRLYWLVTGLLLLVHLAVYIPVLRDVDQVPLLWFAAINAVEWIAIRGLLVWIGGGRRDRPN